MKKDILLFVFCFFIFQKSYAQVHFKTGYHLSFTPGYAQSFEYGINSKIGLEVAAVGSYLFKRISGAAFIINGRYYLQSNKKIYGRFIGIYTSPYIRIDREEFRAIGRSTISSVSERVSGIRIGGMYGRKFLIKKNIFLEFNLGAGRNFSKEVSLATISFEPLSLPKYDLMINFSIALGL